MIKYKKKHTWKLITLPSEQQYATMPEFMLKLVRLHNAVSLNKTIDPFKIKHSPNQPIL